MLETLDYNIRIGSTPTFLYFDLYLYSANAAYYVYLIKLSGHPRDIIWCPFYGTLCTQTSCAYQTRCQRKFRSILYIDNWLHSIIKIGILGKRVFFYKVREIYKIHI